MTSVSYIFLICFFVLYLPILVYCSKREIHDPLNIFCGSQNCYEILGVSRESSLKDIKKAYRKLSLTNHPDRNKDENATEVFRVISKAYEVLEKNDSRTLFDYYLDHPRDYFKVSGKHYFRNLPKSDVRVVLIFVIILISLFQYYYQSQRYQTIVNKLVNLVLNYNVVNEKQNSKQSIELFNRSTDLYEKTINENKSDDDKISVNKSKMIKDPIFAQVVRKVVLEVKIEGGYRRPTLKDLFFYQLVILPYTLYNWWKKYHRRYISKEPFTEDEKIELAVEVVGKGIWEEELTDLEKKQLIDMEIWKNDNRSKWDELKLDIFNEDKETIKPGSQKLKKKIAKKPSKVKLDKNE